jgi:hypothetical protein
MAVNIDHLPGSIPRPEHDMPTYSPRNVQVDLNIVRRRPVQRFAVLPPEPVQIPTVARRDVSHEQAPRSVSPPVRDTLVRPRAQLAFLLRADVPFLHVRTLVS